MVRGYRQARRKETAEETRERIVRATFDLHAEKGIVATSMRDIAERAGVSVGSVYNHFPTYDDAVTACGAYAMSIAPPPSTALFGELSDRRERVRRLALAVFGQFEGLRALGHVIAEQERLPVLRSIVERERAERLTLAAAAVGAPETSEAARTLAALLDHRTYEALRDVGLTTEEAARRTAEVANAWLDLSQPQPKKENV